MSFGLQRLHDLERGEGVVGCVEQLSFVEFGEGPVAGGCFLGLLEALFEQNSDRSAYADLSPVAHLAKDLVEIENMIERDSESIADLSVIVL